jgi:hypothetical protein
MKVKKILLIPVLHLMCVAVFSQIPIQKPDGKTDVVKKPPPLSNFNYGVIPQTANFSENSGYEYSYTAGACQQVSTNAWVFLFSRSFEETRAFRFDANLATTNIIDQVKFSLDYSGTVLHSNKHTISNNLIENYSVANIISGFSAIYYLFGEKNGSPTIVSYNPHPNVGFDTLPLGSNPSSLTGLPTNVKAVTFNNKIYLFSINSSGLQINEFKPNASNGNKFPIVPSLSTTSGFTKVQVTVGKASGNATIFILKNGSDLFTWNPLATSLTLAGSISTTLKDELLTFSRVNTKSIINLGNPDQFIKEYPHVLGDGANGTGAIPLKSFFYRGTNDWKDMDNKFTTNNQSFSTKNMIAIRCGKPTFLITPTSINKMIAP